MAGEVAKGAKDLGAALSWTREGSSYGASLGIELGRGAGSVWELVLRRWRGELLFHRLGGRGVGGGGSLRRGGGPPAGWMSGISNFACDQSRTSDNFGPPSRSASPG